MKNEVDEAKKELVKIAQQVSPEQYERMKKGHEEVLRQLIDYIKKCGMSGDNEGVEKFIHLGVKCGIAWQSELQLVDQVEYPELEKL